MTETQWRLVYGGAAVAAAAIAGVGIYALTRRGKTRPNRRRWRRNALLQDVHVGDIVEAFLPWSERTKEYAEARVLEKLPNGMLRAVVLYTGDGEWASTRVKVGQKIFVSPAWIFSIRPASGILQN